MATDAQGAQKAHPEQVDGIIIDPPTAAQSKAGFWSVRKDYEQLVRDCFERLLPGGVMLICRNDRKRTQALEPLVREAALATGFQIKRLSTADPAPDYPSLEGFPEGESFEGLLIEGA